MTKAELFDFMVETAEINFGAGIFKRRELMDVVAARLKSEGKWLEKYDEPSTSKGIKDKGMEGIDWGFTPLRQSGRLEHLAINQWRVATSVDIDQEFTEGGKSFVAHLRIERNPALMQAKKRKLFGKPLHCKICTFDFADTYGSLGLDYIEGHHIQPLSTLDGQAVKNRLDALILVCSNCHRMIHRHLKVQSDQNDLLRLRSALLVKKA